MDKQEYELGEFTEAVRYLKNALYILFELDSKLAAAAISVKLVDCLDSVAAGNIVQATNDVWVCSYNIYKILYESMAAKFEWSAISTPFVYGKEGAKAYASSLAVLTTGTVYHSTFARERPWKR